MPLQVGLNIVTLVMCIITLAVATTALLPQIKAGLVLLRDLLLWTLLAGFLGFVGFYGWVRLAEIKRANAATQNESVEPQDEADNFLQNLGPLSRTEQNTPPTRNTQSREVIATSVKPQSSPNPNSRSSPGRRPTTSSFRANRSHQPLNRQPTKQPTKQPTNAPRDSRRATPTRTMPLAIESH